MYFIEFRLFSFVSECLSSYICSVIPSSLERALPSCCRLGISASSPHTKLIKGGHPKNAYHADCRPCRLSTFFLLLVLEFNFDLHFFGSSHQYIGVLVIYEHLCTGRASSVFDFGCVTIAFVRETPFSPKYILKCRNKLHL